jgi:hypothetical protein
VLRRIFGPMRKEVTGSWRRLHNEELHNLYASSYVIGRMRWAGHVALMRDKNAHKFLIEKSGRLIPLEGSRRRWKIILK